MDFMLDTSALNRILDGRAGNEWSLRGRNFVTDIQLQEVLDTPTDARREYLLYGVVALQLNIIRPTEMRQLFDAGQNFVTGERFRTGMGTAWYRNTFPLSFGNYVLAIASELPANKKRPANPLRDGFIAEAALLNGMTLVTADGRLAEIARAFGTNVEHIG
jgi:predicted nucleic acid-binding protein